MARVVGAAAALGLVLFLLTPTGCYLSRAGWEEAKILARRRPIAELVNDERVDRETRARLALVLAARAFAVDSLRLRVKESFTTYSRLERDTLVLVLSAAHRDRLEPYTWWFPIVGRVPYKGFFDFGAARRAARELERRGFDIYLRPSAAFSTLGWFNDPLLSTTLQLDTLDLVNTVIHEVTHNTFYAPGQAVFNESFANFVGARGAGWFFRARGQPRAAAAVDADWADDKLFARFWAALHRSIDSAFAAHPNSREARLVARDSVYARARRRLVDEIRPRLRRPISAERLARIQLDNAALLARRVYSTDLEVFDRILVLEGGDLRRTVQRIVRLARERPKDPFGALTEWVGRASGGQ